MTISSFDPSSGRNIKTPFAIKAKQGSKQMDVVCTRVLRNLPDKRLVCSGTCGNHQVVVKIFLSPKRAEKHRLREQKGLAALARSGVCAPEILLEGNLDPERNPVIILKKIDPATSLDRAWEKAENTKQRGEVLKQVMEVVALQHESGIFHEDMHLGNFMLSENNLYALDGAAVRTRHLGHPLPIKKSLDNLALFFAQIYPQFDPLIPDAFRSYLQKRKWRYTDEILERLEKKISKKRQYRQRKYLKKIYRKSSAHVCKKSLHKFIICDRSLYTREMENFLENPDVYFTSSNVLKNGNSSTVARVNVDGHDLVIKRYNIKNRLHGLSRAFRPSRAWISWKNAHRLNILGIATPAPVAMIENRLGPLRSKAYFIARYAEGKDIGRMAKFGDISEKTATLLAVLFTGLIKKLADSDIAHGDLKASNFFLSGQNLVVMDLDAMHKYLIKSFLRRRVEKDCNRLLKNWENEPEIRKIFCQYIKNAGF
jgi:tRNA A-37 threonylcarbamoyl transferase component Bud32